VTTRTAVVDTATATATLMELLDGLRRLTDAARRPDLTERLTQARCRVTDPSLRVVVTGQTGNGMSALVAALIGAEPAAHKVPVVVAHGEAAVRHMDDHIMVDSPHTLLADGLELVDVPGTSGEDSQRAAAALSLLPSADAVLFVSDASQELTAPELAYLDQVQQLCPTVIGVITKIDQYPRWSDIQKADRSHLTRAGIDIPLLPVSSTMAQLARRGDDPELAVESGLPQLVEFLRRRVVDAAETVTRDAVINDIRVVSDHLAMALNAELDTLADPTRGAELVDRLRAAKAAADQMRQRTANWQYVLGDGATELTVDIEHDLRHRLRTVIREADENIMRSDPVKRWDSFSAWLDGRVAECVRENFVLAHIRSQSLARTVGTRFAEDGRVSLPQLHLDDAGGVLDPVRSLEPVDSRKDGIVQRVINSLRGSYGGILMVGVTTSLVGLALVNPWSIGAGVLLVSTHSARTGRRSPPDARPRRR
jgi:hypothetical protein